MLKQAALAVQPVSKLAFALAVQPASKLAFAQPYA